MMDDVAVVGFICFGCESLATRATDKASERRIPVYGLTRWFISSSLKSKCAKTKTVLSKIKNAHICCLHASNLCLHP